MHLGYLIPEFPGQTHAFFWREAQALSSDGFTIHFLSTRRPAQISNHPFAAKAAVQTTYLARPSLRALRYLLRHPIRALRAAHYILTLPDTGVRASLPLLALILPAAQLIIAARDSGMTHVHIHSFANAAHLGALGHILDDLAYSLTLHGDLAVYGQDHAAKARRASLITTVTQPLAEQVRAELPDTDPKVITMGVDIDRFSPKGGAHEGPIRIASIARLYLTKGHAEFLQAMSALVGEGLNLHYTIAGDGPSRDTIAAQIIDLNLSENVTMTGSIGEDAVLALLRNSDIFALTSYGLGEAAPVAVMEAMSCGLPVICSRIGGTGAMIDDGTDGILVPQRDVAAITAALRKLATEPALRQQLGKAARLRAVRQFDYRMTARALGDAIRSAQKKSAPPN